MQSKPRILFVCGRNQWRSPTAVQIYRNDPRLEVRSAGVSSKSRHPLSAADLEWADLVLVMEQEYKVHIQKQFARLSLPKIENLEIPDEYEYMHPELVDLLRQAVEARLALINAQD